MKLFERTRRNSMFYTFVLSCLLLLIIPILLVTAFSYNTFIAFLRTDVANGNAYMLTNLKNTLDAKIIKLISIAVEIRQNYRLTPYAIDKDVMGKMEAIDELKKYRKNDDIISEIALYVHGEEVLYTSSSTYSVRGFVSSIYRYDGWSYDDFYRALNAFGEPVLRNAEPVYAGGSVPSNYLTYIVAGSKTGEAPSTTVVFLIQEDNLRKLYAEASNPYTSDLIVFDRSGAVLSSYKGIAAAHLSELAAQMGGAGEGSGTVTLGGVRYLCTRITSAYTGWTYLTLVRNEDAMGYLYDIRRKNIVAILVVLCLGILLIGSLVRINYVPLRRLRDFSQNLLGGGRVEGNEITAIEKAMAELHGQGKELRKRLVGDLPAVREYLLQRLLQGTFREITEFNEAARDAGIALTKPLFAAAVFSSRRLASMDAAARRACRQIIDSVVDGRIEGCGRDVAEDGAVAYVFSFAEADAARLAESLRGAQRRVFETLGVTMTVGVGSSCDSSCQIGRSYMEANAALDYRIILGENTVIFFEDISLVQKGRLVDYPDEELKSFQFCLKQGNGDDIERILTSIVAFITEKGLPLLTTRCIYYDIITTIIRTFHDYGSLSEEFEKVYYNIEKLADFSTVEEFVEVIRGVCSSVCRTVLVAKESRNHGMKDRLLLFIDESCGNPNLSVRMIADRFGVSQAYVSRFFKDQTGVTLSEYIASKRIEKAKQLLATTTLTLKEILPSVGYYNETSFARTFKRKEGITPGEFRRLA